MLRVSQIADGKDPDASQMMTDFMDMKNIVERSNLPTIESVLCMASLDIIGQMTYPQKPDNIFFKLRDSLARAYMAHKGEKSKQVVDLWRQTPNIVDMTTSGEQQKSTLDKLLGRGKTE